MSKKYVNPFLFFQIEEDGSFLVWDYKNHAQYQIEPSYLQRLLSIAQNVSSSNDELPLDSELLEANLISHQSYQSVEWGWDALSKIHHVGTQNALFGHDLDNYQSHLSEYLSFCDQEFPNAPVMVTEKDGRKIPLPAPDISLLEKISLWDALKNRKTSREFDALPISFLELSNLLYASFGTIHKDWPDLEEFGLLEVNHRKASPSVGGLNCAEAYVIALKVDGLAPGVYHYQSHNHQLREISLFDYSTELGHLLGGQQFANRLSVGIAITARFDKCWHKYKHSRGYNALLVDVGHLSQTFQLVSAGLKIPSWLTGLFLDDELTKVLRIENTCEYPLFFVGAGRGSGHSLSREMQEHFKSSS